MCQPWVKCQTSVHPILFCEWSKTTHPRTYKKYTSWVSSQFNDIQVLGVCRDWMNNTLAFYCSEACKYLFLTKRPKIMFILFHHIFRLRIFLLFFEISILIIKANINWMKPAKCLFSPLIHCWNNVVNLPFMCQCWINDEIMLSINCWCVNVESTMM